MKPFDQLTNQGKVRRLRKLAINALAQYEFKIADIRLVGTRLNTLFQVRTVGGPAYILRICGSGWRTSTDLLSEMIWLQALSCDTDIGTPVPQPARNGDFIVRAWAEGVPEAYPCVVMSWIPGALLGTRLTETNLYKMGVLCARLHEQAVGFSPPIDFTRRKMDTVYVCGEQDVLFGDSCREAFTPRTRDIFERTRDKIYEAFERLYADPTGLRVIHNDLHHNNIKIYQGHLYPLDFEFMMRGYPVQDFAVALDGLMDTVQPDEFEPLQRAFRQGYESRLTWPERYEGQIDPFRAARKLWVANYIAQFEREHLREFINGLAPRFDRFLETGLIRKS